MKYKKSTKQFAIGNLADLKTAAQQQQQRAATGAAKAGNGFFGRMYKKLANNSTMNSLRKYYNANGHSMLGGMARQLGRNVLATGAGLGTLAAGVATGGLGAAALGAVGGKFVKNAIQGRGGTSLFQAMNEKKMRDLQAKQLVELRKARTEGRISNDEYERLRNQHLENSKANAQNIHDVATNGGRNFISNIFGFNRNARKLKNEMKDTTKAIKNYQVDAATQQKNKQEYQQKLAQQGQGGNKPSTPATPPPFNPQATQQTQAQTATTLQQQAQPQQQPQQQAAQAGPPPQAYTDEEWAQMIKRPKNGRGISFGPQPYVM